MDNHVADKLKDFLNSCLDNVSLPENIGKIQIVSLNFGDTAPEIEITNLTDPCPGIDCR